MPGPEIVLHGFRASPPCAAAEAALKLKGLEHRYEELAPGMHNAVMEEIYGEGRRTVPGIVVDGDPVHGSGPIMERLDQIKPEPALFPEPIADRVREAERWCDGDLQPASRALSWGALHFRPEALGTYGGQGMLDPAGVDFAIRFVRGSWRYNELTAERLAAELAAIPTRLAHVDELESAGIVGGETPNAADLQIGSCARILQTIGDLRPLMEGRAADRLATKWFSHYPGDVPAGAFPAGWVPEPRSG